VAELLLIWVKIDPLASAVQTGEDCLEILFEAKPVKYPPIGSCIPEKNCYIGGKSPMMEVLSC
jgi:hypothetical protein